MGARGQGAGKLIAARRVVALDFCSQRLAARGVGRLQLFQLLSQADLRHQKSRFHAGAFRSDQINSCLLQQVFGTGDFIGKNAVAAIDVSAKLRRHALFYLRFTRVAVGMKLSQQSMICPLKRRLIQRKIGLQLKQ